MKLKLLFSILFTLMLSAASLPSIAAMTGIGAVNGITAGNSIGAGNGIGLSGAPGSQFFPQPSIKAPSAPAPLSSPFPQPSAARQSPSVATSCNAGGCRDSGGNFYSGGIGNVYMNNSGNACVRTGTFLQCN